MNSEVHDGGMRWPLWLHWPARFPAGRQCDQLAAHIDVTPTILEACGVPCPPDVRLDGISLLPLLEGRVVAWPERTIAIQGAAATAVTQVAKEVGASLVVMTTHGHGFAARLALGSPTGRVMHDVDSPLLVVAAGE